MRLRLLLLSSTFILFYIFTNLNWQVSYYLAGETTFGFLQSRQRVISEITTLISWTSFAVISYLTFYFLFYKMQRKVMAIVVFIFVSLPVMIAFRYINEEVISYYLWGVHNYSESMRKPLRYLADNMYYAVYYSSFGIVFFFIRYSKYNHDQQNILLLQMRNAELSFLRSQINPHFLFNSLNNIYSLVYQGSDKALVSIGRLSELLRYMLYTQEHFVSLEKEVKYLINYIDLQVMRYDYDISLAVNLDEVNSAVMIAPTILIPFVENGFKHGDLKDQSKPLTINLNSNNKSLQLLVSNKRNRDHKDSVGGIGLQNSKKRLELLYPGQHELSITEEGDCFKVMLTIWFNEKS
jgi:two-component system LytT family sensor kinase